MPLQLAAQSFLDLAERASALAFVDIEATGLRGDYNSVLVVSVKPWVSVERSGKLRRP